MEAKSPVTAVMSEAIFGSDCGDEAFSNFLKDNKLRYGDVFTNKEILDAVKRRSIEMSRCER